MKLQIDDLGAQGDGVAHVNKRAVFVPFTLAGETVSVSGSAPRYALEKVIDPSSARIEPVCQHFGVCGGCALQHMERTSYLEWQGKLVEQAFAAHGLDVVVGPTVGSALHSRRRVTFSARRLDGKMQIGFLQRGSDEFAPIAECPILMKEIEQHFEVFRQLSGIAVRGSETIQLAVTACHNGIDLHLILSQDLSEGMTADFVRAFSRTPFIRASVSSGGATDILVEREKPMVQFGKAQVPFPPGGFLQAVPEIEDHMAQLVLGHLKKAKNIADLFAGSGTFALRFLERATVHAVEGDEACGPALRGGASSVSGKPLTVEIRDLFEAPLTAKELEKFSGICLDPPRLGAEDQIAEIAKSTVPKVAYVSCNPQTLARDARALVDAGYECVSVTPLDQFLFSPHVEVVALFSKTVARKRPIFGRKV